MNEAEEKLREQIASKLYSCDTLPFKDESHYRLTDYILELVKEAGFLLVETAQLEELSDGKIALAFRNAGYDKGSFYVGGAEKFISQSTIAHNKAKFGQLYRKVG